MEFLKNTQRRSFFSETAYIILNILLAVAVLGVVIAIESPLPAFGLILLSKWRVLAVRPRYWAVNVQSNMVDVIVSLGFVVLLTSATSYLAVQIGLTVLYAIWLLLVKPRSRRSFMIAQAATAVFVGVTAVSIVSPDWYASGVVVLLWIIGYSTARHVLLAYEQRAHISFLSLVWGFVFAEFGWLLYHWTIAYQLIDGLALRLPEESIILLGISFVAERVYTSYNKHDTVRAVDVTLPLLFTVSIVAILLVLFNSPINSLR